MNRRTVLAILGGGSVWTPYLIQCLSQTCAAEHLTVQIYGKTLAHAQEVASFAREAAGTRPAVEACSTLREAVHGAAVVLCQVRIGGMVARRTDEDLPVCLGAVGDESLGIGGLRAAVRTWPFVAEAGPIVRREAPEAWVLNLTNPTDLVTMMWRHAGCRRAVAVCEHLQNYTRGLASLGGMEDWEWKLDIMGTMHVGWITPADRSCADSLVTQRADLKVWMDTWQAIPSPWRMHLSDPEALMREQREAPGGRAQQLLDLVARMRRAIQSHDLDTYNALLAERTPVWYDQTVIPAIVGLLGDSDVRLVVGSFDAWGDPDENPGVPVECWTRIGGDGVRPEGTHAGERCRQDMATFLRHRALAFEAAIGPSEDSVERAVRTDPLSGGVSVAAALKAVTVENRT